MTINRRINRTALFSSLENKPVLFMRRLIVIQMILYHFSSSHIPLCGWSRKLHSVISSLIILLFTKYRAIFYDRRSRNKGGNCFLRDISIIINSCRTRNYLVMKNRRGNFFWLSFKGILLVKFH